jgi:hypothetical protein
MAVRTGNGGFHKIEKKNRKKKIPASYVICIQLFFIRTLYTSPPWETIEGNGHGEPAPTLVPSLS